MKKAFIVILILIICVSSACVRKLQPVATLNDLASKEEIEKRRNWFKQSHAKSATSMAMGATLILFPVAMGIGLIPNEKNLTISEIADVAATKTFDYDSRRGDEEEGTGRS